MRPAGASILSATLLLFACNNSGPAAPNSTPQGPLTLAEVLRVLAPTHGERQVRWNDERFHPGPSWITWQNEKAEADKAEADAAEAANAETAPAEETPAEPAIESATEENKPAGE